MKKYYNKFLNWLIPGRRSRILAKMIIRNQRLGLYEDPFKSNENERYPKHTLVASKVD